MVQDLMRHVHVSHCWNRAKTQDSNCPCSACTAVHSGSLPIGSRTRKSSVVIALASLRFGICFYPVQQLNNDELNLSTSFLASPIHNGHFQEIAMQTASLVPLPAHSCTRQTYPYRRHLRGHVQATASRPGIPEPFMPLKVPCDRHLVALGSI